MYNEREIHTVGIYLTSTNGIIKILKDSKREAFSHTLLQ